MRFLLRWSMAQLMDACAAILEIAFGVFVLLFLATPVAYLAWTYITWLFG